MQVSLYRVWGLTQLEAIVNSTWKEMNLFRRLTFFPPWFQLAFKGFVDSIKVSYMHNPWFYIPTIPTCRAVRLGRPKAAARHATRPKRQGLHGLIANWDTPYEATRYCWYLWVHQIWQSCVYRGAMKSNLFINYYESKKVLENALSNFGRAFLQSQCLFLDV